MTDLTETVARGSKAPRIYERGSMTVAGTIRVNGTDVPSLSTVGTIGQVGSDGGLARESDGEHMVVRASHRSDGHSADRAVGAG